MRKRPTLIQGGPPWRQALSRNLRLVQGELVGLLREGVADNRPVDRASTDPRPGFDKAIRIGSVRWVAPRHLVVVEDIREVPGPEGAGQFCLSGDVAPAHR